MNKILALLVRALRTESRDIKSHLFRTRKRLRELLEAIRESDGCTLQEAADFLAKCLCEARLQETGR